MKILDLYNKFINLNINLQKNDVYQILKYLTFKDYQFIASNLEHEVIVDQESIENMIKELESGKPLAYILKTKHFYGYDFYVDERVLIPRDDTEILVNLALSFLNKNKNVKIADICTGSGVIGITLNKITNEKIVCVDISKEALEVAKINVKTLEAKNVKLIQGDFIKPLLEDKTKYNLLVSNPPYIDINDEDLEDSVKNFEPHLALFAQNKGLKFYEEIFKNIYNIMDTNNKFEIIMEFGFKQKKLIEELFNNICPEFDYEFIKDYSNNWRCLKVYN